MAKYIDAEELKAEIEKNTPDSLQLLVYRDIILALIDSLQQEPIEKDGDAEKLIIRDIMEATAKRVNVDKQDKDKEEEAMLEKINYLRNLGLNE